MDVYEEGRIRKSRGGGIRQLRLNFYIFRPYEHNIFVSARSPLPWKNPVAAPFNEYDIHINDNLCKYGAVLVF